MREPGTSHYIVKISFSQAFASCMAMGNHQVFTGTKAVVCLDFQVLILLCDVIGQASACLFHCPYNVVDALSLERIYADLRELRYDLVHFAAGMHIEEHAKRVTVGCDFFDLRLDQAAPVSSRTGGTLVSGTAAFPTGSYTRIPTFCKQSYPHPHKQPVIHIFHSAYDDGILLILYIVF